MSDPTPKTLKTPATPKTPSATPATPNATAEASFKKSWRPATQAVRAGLERSSQGETAEALYLTSGYSYPDAETCAARFKGEASGYLYGRYGNPTTTMFETRLAALEGAEACLATGSGMAAMFASLACFLKAGDRVVSSQALFGNCYKVLTEILPRFGIQVTLIDGRDLDAWEKALEPGAEAVFFESPSNPSLQLIDIAAVAERARAKGARVIVDNVFATPLLQQPLSLGADVVFYSATKHIDGQGRVLGGAVLGSQDYLDEFLRPFVRHTGPTLSAFNAWVLLKGLETLDLRVQRMSGNALELARVLTGTRGVKRVIYPGLASHAQYELAQRQMRGGGSLLAFEVERQATAFELLNQLRLIDISNNLGDAKSLACHPASSTHQAMDDAARAASGVTPGLVRLSVGLEDVQDLTEDLVQAIGVTEA